MEEGGRSRLFLRFGKSSSEEELDGDDVMQVTNVPEEERKTIQHRSMSDFLWRPTRSGGGKDTFLMRPMRSYSSKQKTLADFMMRPVKKNRRQFMSDFLNRPTRTTNAAAAPFWVRPTRLSL
jgi:hypothetical protein